jgi:nitrite reductase/ring-hydroxylating ferredoxin subunit
VTTQPEAVTTAPRDEWVPVALVSDLSRAGRLVVHVDGTPVLLMWNDGDPLAFHVTCIHKGRSLSEAVVFGGQLVCAGHQWSFDLRTGYCKVRDRYQPVYRVAVDGDNIVVNLATAA